MKGFDINPGLVAGKLKGFISADVSAKGFSKVVLGLSGGLDSTVVAYLSVSALGRENLIGVMMPYGNLSPEALDHAGKIAGRLRIKTEIIDIKPMIDAYFEKISASCDLRRGNKMARERMSILYDFSQKHNALVIGTSNRTEILLGYGTVHGDCACAINPVGGLYKTQLRKLARYLGVPSYILKKPPSADLWQGQTDENEIGYAYGDIDRLLFSMIDRKMNDRKLVTEGFDKIFIEDIKNRVRRNKFKSRLPLVAKI
ncbi:NAD+ synthase [bacterium]|nr:MAG: NAD+ synthase [bacterium]